MLEKMKAACARPACQQHGWYTETLWPKAIQGAFGKREILLLCSAVTGSSALVQITEGNAGDVTQLPLTRNPTWFLPQRWINTPETGDHLHTDHHRPQKVRNLSPRQNSFYNRYMRKDSDCAVHKELSSSHLVFSRKGLKKHCEKWHQTRK